MKKTLLLSTLLVLVINIANLLTSLQRQQSAMLANWANQTVGKNPDSQTAAVPAKLIANPVPTGTVLPGSSQTSGVAERLTAAGLKPDYAAVYLGVESQTGTPWQLLAAVHQVETGQRGDTTVSSGAGAQGPMQFMPATFQSYGTDGDDNGTRDIHDLDDAMLSAGRYLAANGAAKGQYHTALYHYNHSEAYVSRVLGIAHRLGL